MEQQYGGYSQGGYGSQNPYDDRHEIRDDYGRGGYSNRRFPCLLLHTLSRIRLKLTINLPPR